MNNNLSAKLAALRHISLSDTEALFAARDRLPLLMIESEFCSAVVSLQGAQLLSFQPRGHLPWLWLSPLERFEAGKEIWGGIPVCLPWFGVHRLEPDKPVHGFARNDDWQLSAADEKEGVATLVFELAYPANKPELFATAFHATLTMTLSSSIDMRLRIQNCGQHPAQFSWAFHTYFAIDDLSATTVSGLEGVEYLDNTQGLKSKTLTGSIVFNTEVDSVFQNIKNSQQISSQHSLTVNGNNCNTCIIWNPGKATAGSLPYIQDHYKEFICVERGSAFDDTITLAAGESFSASMQITQTR